MIGSTSRSGYVSTVTTDARIPSLCILCGAAPSVDNDICAKCGTVFETIVNPKTQTKHHSIENISTKRQVSNQLSLTNKRQRDQSYQPTLTVYPLNILDQDVAGFTDIECMYFTNVTQTYEHYCLNPFVRMQKTLISQRTNKHEITIQDYVRLRTNHNESSVSFFNHIAEFRCLLKQDKQVLLQRNQRYAVRVQATEMVKHFRGLHSDICSTVRKVVGEDLLKLIYDDDIMSRIMIELSKYDVIFLHDPLITHFLLIILIFSSSFTVTVMNDEYHDYSTPRTSELDILHLQNFYVNLLWKYMVYRLGETETVRILTQFIDSESDNVTTSVVNEYEQVASYSEDEFENEVQIDSQYLSNVSNYPKNPTIVHDSTLGVLQQYCTEREIWRLSPK
ncbi:unnamed protein product [Didymodactylos carnosus]|uniref:Uncharacterized protein n=1 Tax=Didymodactylos carnosus TaxID=1234261 RepID=A0A814IW01_9BILA|nr:unnamed protein product [Didymodactylos carnosus]CAF3799756.1 unnamed protein product [Didymodactylos carnosus]